MLTKIEKFYAVIKTDPTLYEMIVTKRFRHVLRIEVGRKAKYYNVLNPTGRSLLK